MDFKTALLIFMHCYIALLTGLTSFYYDARTRRIKRYRWLKIYTILHNLLVLFLTPFFLVYGLYHSAIWTTNSLVKYSMAISVLTATSMATCTVLFRPQRERQLVSIIMELDRLEHKYFERWFSQTALHATVHHLDRVLYVKVLVTTYLTLIDYYIGLTSIITRTDLKWIMSDIYAIAMGNIANGIITHYIIGLWNICRRYYFNNIRLQQLVEQYEKFGCTYAFTVDLLQVLLVYKKLSLLIGSLNKAYKYQAFFLVSLHFLNNVLTGYYTVLFILSKLNTKGIIVTIHGINYYIGTLLDMLTFNSIWVHILEACSATTFQIQTLMVMPIYDSSLKRICEQAILRFSIDKMRLNVLGFFDIDRHLLFSIMSNILFYIILLLQSDYINLESFLVPEIFI